MSDSTKNTEKQIKMLQSEIRKLNKRIEDLEDTAHRYRHSPFDLCYRLGRKVKYKLVGMIENRRQRKLTDEILPSATVIIPTYKPNIYISDCVKSVLKQDYPKDRLKIIISVNGDDVSYFESLKQKYKNKKCIQVIYTNKKGLSAARNYAKNFIRTDCVTYLDDDDYFTKGYLREMAIHMSSDISVVCGRLVDVYSNGETNEDTYINRTLGSVASGIRKSYLEVGSLFSPFWCKLYKSDLIKSVLGDFDETVTHTEDIIFWVENIYKLQGKIYTCKNTGTEALMRRITTDSMSRPSDERAYSFYITDRITLIERFSKEIFSAYRDTEYKRFVLNKIDASTQHILDYFLRLSQDEQNKARDEIIHSESPFLNKALFGQKRGIAFCHNFSPYVDASAYVASKRLPQIATYIKAPINWIVVAADMSNQREKDLSWNWFFSKYQYGKLITVEGKTFFNEEAQCKWAKRAYEKVKNIEADYIYSRSMWVGSHEAAYFYKTEHPEVYWIAEFSDPVYMGVNNEQRPVARQYDGELSYLNTYWRDIEIRVCDLADLVIFTNENQRSYMLTCNNALREDILLKKSLIWHHPQIASCYARIINSNLQLDMGKINIGYFGTFYPNRDYSAMLTFLSDERVELYIFTGKTDVLEEYTYYHKNLHVLPMVPHLEFLNLAQKMDYCYLNDVNFSGDINPYLPSKLADYLSADTAVIALTYADSSVDKFNDHRLIKVNEITSEFVHTLKKKPLEPNWKYRDDIAECSNFKESFVSTMLTEDILKIGDNLIKGHLDLGYEHLDKPYMYAFDSSIIWNFDRSISSNESTFYLYLLGLRHVYYLSKAFQIDGNIAYLQLAKKLINSFYLYFYQEKHEHEMLFNDHAQSERIENLIVFFHVAQIADCSFNKNLVSSLIYDAVRRLSGDKYYQRRHNHGIIADKACLIGYYFLNGVNKDTEIDYITKRLKEQVNYAFTSDGVHRENSIDYHFLVLDMVIGCLNIYQGYLEHSSYRSELLLIINRAIEYLAYALKPDLCRPLYGDSKGTLEYKSNLDSVVGVINDYNHPVLRYIATKGCDGEAPALLTKWYNSGYIFFREHYNKEEFSNATWLSLKAGYATRTHKHQDDLSLCLYSKGYDIFIDPGMHGYMPHNIYKDYMESVAAHTTVGIRNHSYSVCSGNGDKFKIITCKQTKDYDYAKAVSYVYDNIAIYRHLYYMRHLDLIILRDEIRSVYLNDYIQYFHLGTAIQIDSQNKASQIDLKICDTGYMVSMLQAINIDSVDVLYGDKTVPMSFMSTGFSDLCPTRTIAFNKAGKDVDFVTIIDIHKCDEPSCSYEWNNDQLIVCKLGTKINIPIVDTLQVNFNGISCVKKSESLTVCNQAECFSQHTAYVFDEGSSKVHRYPYTNNHNLIIDCNEFDSARIMYYISGVDGGYKKGLLGEWTTDNDGQRVFNQYKEVITPKNIGFRSQKVGDNEYVFQVRVDYPFAPNVQWWIYRNGALMKSEMTNNFKYKTEIVQPGEYVIMCSARDRYFGEFVFHQFDKIKR